MASPAAWCDPFWWGEPDTSHSRITASRSAIASSIAMRVPEPTEKCAVCTASPSSTTFPLHHRAQRTVGKLRHRDRFRTSAWPSSSSAKSASQ